MMAIGLLIVYVCDTLQSYVADELVSEPHRKRVKHYHQAGHLHELTFSCYRRMPLLTNDSWRRQLSRVIHQACHQNKFQLVAFVFMPEHVHLLVLPVLSDPDIGRYLASFKQPFSKKIKEVLTEKSSPLLDRLTVRERPGKTCFRFWQEGPGFDRIFIRRRQLLRQSTIFTAIG